jgi:hypothetical protein
MKRYKEYIKNLEDGSYIIDLEIKKKLPANYKELSEDQYWSELEEVEVEKLKEIKQDKLSKLQSNKFGYYGILGNTFTGEDEFKNLSIVKLREKRLTATGEIDTRVEQAESGTTCGTGEYSGNKLVIVLYDLLLKSIEDNLEIPNIEVEQDKFNKYTISDKPKENYKKYLEPHIINIMLTDLITNYCVDEYLNKNNIKRLVNKFEELNLDKTKQNKLEYLLSKQYSFKNDKDSIYRVINFLIKNNVDIMGTLRLDKEVYNTKAKKLADKDYETHKDYIHKILFSKSRSTCTALKDWFIINDLYIEKQV